jgi:hypothetical protein
MESRRSGGGALGCRHGAWLGVAADSVGKLMLLFSDKSKVSGWPPKDGSRYPLTASFCGTCVRVVAVVCLKVGALEVHCSSGQRR